jgi:hypothetical protein
MYTTEPLYDNDPFIPSDTDPYNEEIIRERIPVWKRILIGLWDLVKAVFEGVFMLLFWWA